MDSRDLGAALPAGAMLGYGSHSTRFSGEAAKAAKVASAQGSLGFSGDSGRRVVLSAPGYAWHNLLEVEASTSAREKNPSCLSAHLPIAAETARSADSHLAPSWGLSWPLWASTDLLLPLGVPLPVYFLGHRHRFA